MNPSFVPRNLVVLSDGTGNSAAKLQKTNVWRLYDALDLQGGRQLAIYDDGVGTASFKPLAVLGGAFGYGLKRNVLDLYVFLCRNHTVDPRDPAVADRTFAFGFSRGAYTARVLAGMVATCGLITASSDAELARLSRWAYRHYRAERFPHRWTARLGRGLRDAALHLWERLRGKRRFDPSLTRRVDIEFLGVFDTVAAYGLPVEELTRGWEKWIWPMLPKDRVVSPRVKRACHALALDDERQTFFPLLWTEAGEKADATNVHEERLTQVWFTGMHSDVGGGYPDDGLSFAPLAWMAREAAHRGLRFRSTLCRDGEAVPAEWLERQSVSAPMHDSRRGLGVYYRYHPRPVERLCHDDHVDVRVDLPKIHASVLERVRDGVDGYAPVVLPGRYAVVTTAGDILRDTDAADPSSPDGNPFEHASQRLARRVGQEDALNAVWWRRIVYFLTVVVTGVLFLMPLCPARERLTFAGWSSSLLSSVVGLLNSVLPGFMGWWLEYYEGRPYQLVIGGIVVLALIGINGWLRVKTVDRMRAVFTRVGLRPQQVGPVASPTDAVYRLRTSPVYKRAFHLMSYHVVPHVFGLSMLALLAFVLPLRVAFDLQSRAAALPASTCRSQDAAIELEQPVTLALSPRALCVATDQRVIKGRSYRIAIELPAATAVDATLAPERRDTGGWADSRLTPGGDGYSSLEAPGGTMLTRLLLVTALPFRRELRAPWFAVIAQVGIASPQRVSVRDGETLVADRDGPLSFYVNDAVLPCPSWDCFYRNNAGAPARVTITPLAAVMADASH
ncbi:MAG TPA: DUF2235 domain-containing protein [Luteitalea sp.]|nr:DUF2235 domain-containing protein [Luteitalea sp.]